ncbi:MAG: phosphatase PAP2 family protein [Xanthobacteraceae bacterium]
MIEHAEPTFMERILPVLSRMGSSLTAWMATLLRLPRGTAARLQPLWPLSPSAIRAAIVMVLLFIGAMAALDWWMPAVALNVLPQWLLGFFSDVTDFGKSGWFLWPIGLLLLVIAASPTHGLSRVAQLVLAAIVVRLGFIFFAIALPGLFTSLVKRLIGRARPFVSLTAEPYRFAPFSWDEAYTSLPSGHATTAFYAAVAIGAVWPQARIVMWVYAGIIALSRVVMAAHHPSDVIAGAIVGILGALLVRRWFAARRLGFSVDADGSIHALTPPSSRRVKRVAAGLLSQ